MGEDQHPHYRYASFKAVPVKDGGGWSTVLKKNTTALSVKPRR